MQFFSPELVLPLYLLVASSSRIPAINVENTCRAIEKNVAMLVENGVSVFEVCMRQQREAREKLENNWTKFSASDKQQCVSPNRYAPNYVEWLSCLETVEAVRALRKNEQKSGNR